MRFLLRLFWIGFFVAVVAGAGLFWFIKEISVPASGDAEPVVFQVKSGSSGVSVAQALEEEGLITNGMAFRLLLTYYEKKKGATLQAGHFKVDPKLDIRGVLDELLYGKTLTRKATIPEGYTKEQTAKALEKQGIVAAQDYWSALKDADLGWKFPSDLEGYLFPSTYEFPYQCTGPQAVAQMTGQFRAVLEPLLEKYGKTKPLNLKETIILASLIEREAQVARERPVIAQVYINRVAINKKLECDATVQFALGKPKAVLLYKDLEIASPYNTYRHKGWPPGPICSPGAASIEAALNPKKHKYLYYVRNDVKNDGSHVFAEHYYQHEANIRKYQR